MISENVLFDAELSYWDQVDHHDYKGNFEGYAKRWLMIKYFLSPTDSYTLVKNFRKLKKSLALAVAVINVGNQYLLVKTTGRPYFEFPGGKIMPGEDSLDATIRELKEETGIIVNKEDSKELILPQVHKRKIYCYMWTFKETLQVVPPNPYEIIDVAWIKKEDLDHETKNSYASQLINQLIL